MIYKDNQKYKDEALKLFEELLRNDKSQYDSLPYNLKLGLLQIYYESFSSMISLFSNKLELEFDEFIEELTDISKEYEAVGEDEKAYELNYCAMIL